mmetsp:Transcript_100/g.152  ORF Transcript_100/g.152 Transcript_100/m.152 type:complete len:113 (-) Transcript_100:254-592(-)
MDKDVRWEEGDLFLGEDVRWGEGECCLGEDGDFTASFSTNESLSLMLFLCVRRLFLLVTGDDGVKELRRLFLLVAGDDGGELTVLIIPSEDFAFNAARLLMSFNCDSIASCM